jgi:hypothetical protein
MARGAAQAKRKPAKPPPKRKRAAPTYEQAMFFPRLRRQAKWVFVFLALVFGVGFVAFGVGSGSTGISDILRGNFFGGGNSTGSRIKDAQKKIKLNPKDRSAYLQLSALYQQNGKIPQAITTLEQAPSNYDVLSSLAGLYSGQAQQALNAYQNARVAIGQANATPFDLGTLSQAFSQDLLAQSLQSNLSQAQSAALAALQKVVTSYRRAASAASDAASEAGAQLQIASAAVQALQLGQASDIRIAIAAYKRYLKLEPGGAGATQVRRILVQLRAALPKSQR